MTGYTWEFTVRPGDAPRGRSGSSCTIYGPGRRIIGTATDATTAQKVVDALNASAAK